MKQIYLYNTLSKQVEKFEPIDELNIKMYVCGPTVYADPHIGNYRSIVIYDLLYRTMKSIYNKVTYVRNVTDIDDKIINAAKSKSDIPLIVKNAYKSFKQGASFLNCLDPDLEPMATENISEMIKFIESLIEKGHAYAVDQYVYFDVDSYPEYGQLSKKDQDKLISSERTEIDKRKKNPLDFVLWKPDSFIGWKSPWGESGRPGWHLECSAMSTKYLSPNFDIHGGGIDLQFPHHENEIAQSRCAYKGSIFAKYWVHNGFVTINGEKMSKSIGNIKTINDIINDGIDPAVLRYIYLSTHYRKPLDWNDSVLKNAESNIIKIKNILKHSITTEKLDNEVQEALLNDLNTPKALTRLHHLITQFNKSFSEEILELIRGSVKFLGIMPTQQNTKINTKKIEALVNLRKSAKAKGDYKYADEIRDELINQGVKILDKKNGETEWVVKE